MTSCVIFGGSGYIGTHLTEHFLKTGRFDHVHIADIRPTSLEGRQGVSYSNTDVRLPIGNDIIPTKPEWIFNLAAIHREPGHEPHEYYTTNIPGAYNVCEYAERIGCDNIYFSSSISVYGPTVKATDENSPLTPKTPYGGSKFGAEWIHKAWQKRGAGRRLLISRPGVIYGPGDPGNILRMINAIRKGYFAYPGSSKIFKSYGYIYGLIDSVDFVLDSGEDCIIHNYVENPTEPLGELVKAIKRHLNTGAVVLPLPQALLMPAAKIIQRILGARNPVHPVRVKKAATPTHIVPGKLAEMGFKFKYSFAESLKHWQMIRPEDFGLPKTPETSTHTKIKLERGAERAPDAKRPKIELSESVETGERSE